MADILDFFGQKWQAARVADMDANVRHTDRPDDEIQLFLTQAFYPPWSQVEDEDGCKPHEDHREMDLELFAYARCDGDWRKLAGLHMDYREEVICGKEVILPDRSPPEFTLESHDGKCQSFHTHLKHSWNCTMTFGASRKHDPFLLPFSLEAFCPSDRARAASLKLSTDEIKRWFDPVPEDFEAQELVKEGRWFHYTGHCRLNEIHCTVPENSSDPVGYAKALAKKRLGLTEFGFCRVNGGDRYLETWQPEHGILPEIGGRLVILDTVSDYYRKHADTLRQSAVRLEEFRKKYGPQVKA